MPKPDKPPGKPDSPPAGKNKGIALSGISAIGEEGSMAVMLLKTVPTLPELMDTTYAAPSGATIVVPDGGNFQTALNNANPGDTITLNAGSTYTGNFSLPVKSGSSYIHIRSSAPLTPEGIRVTTGDLTGFPKIVTPDVAATIQAAVGAHHYRFINCDIKSGSTAVNGKLIGLGTGDETSDADFPHHIILDRCGIRGSSANGGRRGVFLCGSYQAVIDSYASDWKEVGADTQAIAAWSGRGPYKIVNNYLEAAGENVLFGGSVTLISDLTPSDIEVRGNHMFKPLTWKIGDPSYLGTAWSVKNIFELKHAQRVLVEDNLFENCWVHSQTGCAILFTPRNQGGGNPWTFVRDVTFRRNELRNSASALNVLGTDDEFVSQTTKRILIENNLFHNIYDTDGFLFQVMVGAEDVKINHNTADHETKTCILTDVAGLPNPRFIFTNNIVRHNLYGIFGSGVGSGNPAIAVYYPGGDFRKNVIVGADSGSYPANNFYPATVGEVGFQNYPTDLRLTSGSAYHNAALDGTDVGADPAFLAGL